MKTIIKILFLCGIIVLTAFSCEKLKTNDYNPERYVNIKVDTEITIDNCGCNERVIKEYKNKMDTLNVAINEGLIIKKTGIMTDIAFICNLPNELLDTSQNKVYPIIFSGEVHPVCRNIIGPATVTYCDIILTELKIKFK